MIEFPIGLQLGVAGGVIALLIAITLVVDAIRGRRRRPGR